MSSDVSGDGGGRLVQTLHTSRIWLPLLFAGLFGGIELLAWLTEAGLL